MDSLRVEQESFPFPDGGATPTSTLQLQLKLVPAALALKLYDKWHYLHATPFIGSIHFGIWFDGEWMGAISYGPPNATEFTPYWNRLTQNGWWEIKRMALSPFCPKNSESRSIAISINLLRKMERCKGIVTYADTAQGHEGTIYKATGFLYLGLTDEKQDFCINGVIQQRGTTKDKEGKWIPRSRKHAFIKLLEAHHATDARDRRPDQK